MTTRLTTSSLVTLALVSDYEFVVLGLAKMLEPFGSRVRIVDPAAQPDDVPVDVALYATFTEDQARTDVEAWHVVLYLLNEDTDVLADARARGADGVLSPRRRPEDLVDALERICAGETVLEVVGDTDEAAAYDDWPRRATSLSVREAKVIALITQGMSNAEIAHTLALSTNSIKSYIRSAYRRMNVTSAVTRSSGPSTTASQGPTWSAGSPARRRLAVPPPTENGAEHGLRHEQPEDTSCRRPPAPRCRVPRRLGSQPRGSAPGTCPQRHHPRGVPHAGGVDRDRRGSRGRGPRRRLTGTRWVSRVRWR